MRRILVLALALSCGGASRSKVRQVAGELSVTPGTLDFGDVALGKESTLEAMLENSGIAPMGVTALALPTDGAFEVRGLPAALGPGQRAKVSVTYRPPALGTHTRNLQLTTDGPEAGPAAIDLRGHAVRGLATLSGDSFDFGDVVVNRVATQTFSLSNNDGHALTSVRIEPPTGGDSGAFTVRPPGELPLQPEQSMVVTIDFKPGRLGDFSAVVPVTPCPTCAVRNLSLQGRGVERVIDVEPAQIDFGLVLLGAAAERAISVRNTSRSPVTLQSPALTGSPQFEVSIDNATFPLTLAPGQSVTGVARFRPRELGAAQAQASLPASDGGPGALALQGTGFGPVLQPTPKSVFLGATALGTTRSGSLQVTNVGLDPQGTAPLAVSNISVISSDPAWRLDTATPLTVGAPGASATIRFSFSPRAAGPSQMTLVIGSNDGLHPEVQVPVVALGRALPPCNLAASQNPIDFGSMPIFQRTVQGVELTNKTSDDCIVGEPSLSGDPAFRWPGGVTPAGRTLPPGGRMSVRIEFAPEQARTYSGAVTFYVSNPSAPSMSIPLTGVGDGGCFYLSPSTANFGATTLGCGIPPQTVYAINHCDHWIKVTSVSTAAPFGVLTAAPFDVPPQSHAAIQVTYQPTSRGDDVGTLVVGSSESLVPRQAGLTGGAQPPATVLDQWDQSSPKVDMLFVIDNSGSMAEEQLALANNLDRLWNRIALANADFHIAVTTTGMIPYTAGWSQCPGGANGGEAGRFFPVDASRPRLLTPTTPDVKNVLFQNTAVGQCHWKEQFTEPVVAALTDPLISSTKAPGTPWPSDGNAGFLRDDARLALLAVSDADDDIDIANPPPVSYLVDQLRAVKHGALDLVSFAGIVPLTACSTSEGLGTRYQQIAQALHGRVFDICKLSTMGDMLDAALGDLLQPLSSFPLSAVPKDPTAIVVTVNGVVVTDWSYDAAANRIVFPPGSVPPPGSHITAKYEPACS